MRINDAVVGAALTCFSGALIAYSLTFPSIPGQDYGPGLFPILIGVGLAGCGIGLVVKGVADREERPLIQLPDWASSPRLVVNFALGIGGIVFYMYTVDVLGFLLTAFAILATLFIWLRGRLVSSLVFAATISLATHIVFHNILLVPLPWGVLQPIAW